MTALYVIGNTNLDTVESVAKSIVNIEKDFSKIFILNSSSAHEVLEQQIAIYTRYLGDIRHEELLLQSDGSIDQNKLIFIFKEHDRKFIDLTNGLKITASILYMAANLCGIDNVYYLMKKADNASEYIKMQKFDEAQSFAKLSFFDLIYYNDEIDGIFREVDIHDPNNSFLGKIYNELKNSVTEFFINNNYKNTIISATSGNEVIVKKLLKYIQDNRLSSSFAKKNKIDLWKIGYDPIGILTYFYKFYMQNSNSDIILELHCVPWFLSTLRAFRNSAAHYAKHSHVFSYGEARVVINTSIEMYKTIRRNENFWRLLNE